MRSWILLLSALSYGYLLTGQVFSEQTDAVNVDHTFQARGLMGGGAVFFDFDQDGDDDLYLVGGLQKDELYRNTGSGTFAKVLDDIGLGITTGYNTTSAITGDVDNDGDRDLFVTTWETYENGNETMARCLLFEQTEAGIFIERGEAAGIREGAFSIGANFLDFNKDGYLDIYVLNHVETPAFLYDEFGAIVGFDHACYPNYLYQNNGDWTFTQVAAELGLEDLSCTLAAMPTDYDGDGDLDLYLANDFGPFIVPNLLFANDYPNTGFSEVGAATGSGIPMYGMGVAAGDYDHDQDLDYYITNLGANVLLENDSGGTFTEVATIAGVANEFANDSEFATGWGTAFFDVNNDSWVDLFVANGRIPSLSSLPTAMSDPDKLYLNNGDKTFTDVSVTNGINDPNYGRGMAYSDFDQDGDLDFIVVNLSELGGVSRFYRNESDNGAHFLQFKLVGTVSNRDAFGAKLMLHAGEEAFVQETYGGGASFCSQHSSVVHFGLGEIGQVDSVVVAWPSGNTETFVLSEVDRTYTLTETNTMTNTMERIPAALKLTLVPNPAFDRVRLQLASPLQKDLPVRLLDGRGQLVRTLLLRAGEQDISWSLEGLAAGLYYLYVPGQEAKLIQKLVKMR